MPIAVSVTPQLKGYLSFLRYPVIITRTIFLFPPYKALFSHSRRNQQPVYPALH
ncbi:MAG TPA: hypothetical protein VGE90_16385 [Chitinophaga sp.]